MLARKKTKTDQKNKQGYSYGMFRGESMERAAVSPLQQTMATRDKSAKNITSSFTELVSYDEKLKHIEDICKKLTLKYEAYAVTREFIEYLRQTTEVFEQTRQQDMSIEQTRAQLIKWEIKMLSDDSGVDSEVFDEVYREFSHAFTTTKKISVIVAILRKRYSAHEHCGPIMFLVGVLSDCYLVFEDALENEVPMGVVQDRVIHSHITNISQYSHVPPEVLDSVYDEFRELISA